jgi:DNA mismatch endonuclease (patch repair protein)
MVDIFSKEKRSQIMRRIQGKNTRPEMIVRSLLHKNGYRFRLHRKELPGEPDIILPRYKVAIFIHGCYWHRHSCRKGKSLPTTNCDFWNAKFQRTILRDKENKRELKRLGWKVITLWECQLANEKGVLSTLSAKL